MDKLDRQYFLQRAETELDMARRADDEAAVRAHSLLAGLYFDRVYRMHGERGNVAGGSSRTPSSGSESPLRRG